MIKLNEILTEAREQVEKASLPERLEPIAFEKIVQWMLNQKAANVGSPESAQDKNSRNTGMHDSVISKISESLGVDSSVVEEVYYMDGDSLEIIVSSKKLDSSVAGATKEIALLLAGGRQLGGLEEWTGADKIREICDHFSKYDSTNFAKTIMKMENEFSFMGSGQKRKVRITKPGTENLTELVHQITRRDDK